MWWPLLEDDNVELANEKLLQTTDNQSHRPSLPSACKTFDFSLILKVDRNCLVVDFVLKKKENKEITKNRFLVFIFF